MNESWFGRLLDGDQEALNGRLRANHDE